MINPAIIIGEKGIQWYKLTFFGVAGHGTLPKRKSNAINKANRFMTLTKNLKLPKVKPPFKMRDLLKAILSRYRIHDLLELLGSGKGEEKNPYDEDGLPLNIFFDTTYSFNQIHAGTKVNVIPDVCEVEVDFRVLPGITTQQMFDAFRTLCIKIGISNRISRRLHKLAKNSSDTSKTSD